MSSYFLSSAMARFAKKTSFSGGAIKSGTTGGMQNTFMILLLWAINLMISGAIVFWTYNKIMPRMAEMHQVRYIPITFMDAMLLVILTHALIW